jgi:ribosome-binding factor A
MNTTESRRQKQVASEVQHQLSLIFIKEGYSIIQGCLVTIAGVKVTPDLLIVKIYLSFFNPPEGMNMTTFFNEKKGDIRRLLGAQMKYLRRIPELEFFSDKTLDEVYRVEQLLQAINPETKD